MKTASTWPAISSYDDFDSLKSPVGILDSPRGTVNTHTGYTRVPGHQ